LLDLGGDVCYKVVPYQLVGLGKPRLKDCGGFSRFRQSQVGIHRVGIMRGLEVNIGILGVEFFNKILVHGDGLRLSVLWPNPQPDYSLA